MRDDGVPRFYPDGGFAGYIGSCVDITEQRDAKRTLESLVAEKTQNLKAANDELRRLTRLKDEWVSNVSHELRSPLTSLRVRIHLLENDPTMLADHLPALARETKRLSDTIEDLLKLSRWDQGGVEIKRQLVDIDGLLRDFVADRQMAADEHDLHLRYMPCPDPQETLCDPGLISQVIDILISNALKYVPAGGEIVARSLSEAGRVGFAIEDDGPGIPPHERPHLFERFYRGETGRSSGRKGTGLGLSIAKTIVDHHGGSISMSSEPGSGTTFTVWLPLTKKGRPPEG
jgi:signal transduction histidine kinase